MRMPSATNGWCRFAGAPYPFRCVADGIPSTAASVVSVGGAVPDARLDSWLRGRTIEAPLTYRRPARYLDEGVPDSERDLALAGTTLFGTAKSGLLVSVIARGGVFAEWFARVRSTPVAPSGRP